MIIRDATPEYWIDGRQHRPLRRRHSGKGRAVPALVLDPNRSSLNCAYEPRQGLVPFRHPQTPLLWHLRGWLRYDCGFPRGVRRENPMSLTWSLAALSSHQFLSATCPTFSYPIPPRVDPDGL